MQLFLTLLLVLFFFIVLTVIIGYKMDWFLKSMKDTLRLEVSNPVGRICILGILLMAALFLFVLMSDKAMALIKPYLQPEAVHHSINVTMLFLILAFVFIGNQIVLLILFKRP